MCREMEREWMGCEAGEGDDCEGRERPYRIEFGMVVLML